MRQNILPQLNSTIRDLLISLAIGSVVIWFFFGFYLATPGDFTFASSGDGLKNYYTFSYFVENDANFHFSGMNYPHGEFSVYTDNHPIFAEVLSFIHRHVIDLSGKSVAILNTSTILAYLLTILIFVLLFREYKIQGAWAIIGSLLITFLTPQTNRMMAHYSLSYSFMFPLIWLLVLKLLKADKKWIYSMLLISIMLIQSLIHTYHLFIALVFLGAFTFVYAIYYRGRSKILPYLLATLLISASAFLVFTKSYDQLTDRPQFPYGLATYTTSVAGTFLPYKTALAGFIKEYTGQFHSRAESHGYIGLGVIITLILFLFRRARNYHRKTQGINIPESLQIALFASILAWLFGTNWINEFTNDLLYKILPPLRQFRGLGRLGWIFYYVISFFSLFYLYHLTRSSKSSALKNILIFGLLALWAGDAYFSVSGVTSRMDHRNKQLNRDRNKAYDLYLKTQLDSIDFQAILSLPLCHIGNEKIAIERGAFTMSFGMGLSYCTRLPLINSMMSRTSISQGLNQIQLVNDKAIYKNLIPALDNRDILIFLGPEKPSVGEKNLLEKAELLASGNDFSFYRIKKESFVTTTVASTEGLNLIEENGERLFASMENDPFLSYQHFDQDDQSLSLAGAGSKLIRTEQQVLFDVEFLPDTTNTKIHLSLWLYVDPALEGMPKLHYSVLEKGKEIFGVDPNYVKNLTSYDSWIYLEYVLEPGKRPRRFQLSSNASNTRIDELLIRSEGNQIHYIDKTSKMIFIDNIPVEAAK